jgi:uncharacterized protein (TIGR01244 family)
MIRSTAKRPFFSTIFLSLAFLGFLGLAGTASADSQPSRPANWAGAVTGTHVPNLYRVEPDLLRSAQPDAAGFQELATLGVKTVLDLRAGHEDASEAGKAALRFLHVPMRAWSAQDDLVIQALRILADPSNRPILVHCQKGADRTGMILALYRVVVQGWTKEDAIREMDDGGYHHSSLFRNLDRYVSNANVAALRRELGVAIPGVALAANAAPASPLPAQSASKGPAIPDKLALQAPSLVPLASAAAR